MRNKFLSFFFLVLISSPLSIFAAGWLSISPLKHELSLNPGQTQTVSIKVTNNEQTPVTIYTSREDFTTSDDTWTPKFIKPQDQTSDTFSLSNWINIENDNITLSPWETREIRAKVTVPANWEPGWHYWAVFFSMAWANKAQISVVQRYWVLMLVNVAWDIQINWWLNWFSIWQKDSKNIFTEKKDFNTFPILFGTKFKNDWNTHLKPTWKIELVDENWEILKNIWKETISNAQWAYMWEKMVDYIPVNDGNWNVLPKSERKFESNWEWFWYQVLNEDWTKSVKFKNLTEYYASKAAEKRAYLNFWESIHNRSVNKKIVANLTLNYEWKDNQKKEFKESKVFYVKYNEQYVWVNYFLVLLILLIIWGSVYYFVVVSPKQKEKLKQQLLEEIQKNNWQK